MIVGHVVLYSAQREPEVFFTDQGGTNANDGQERTCRTKSDLSWWNATGFLRGIELLDIRL